MAPSPAEASSAPGEMAFAGAAAMPDDPCSTRPMVATRAVSGGPQLLHPSSRLYAVRADFVMGRAAERLPGAEDSAQAVAEDQAVLPQARGGSASVYPSVDWPSRACPEPSPDAGDVSLFAFRRLLPRPAEVGE